MQLIDTNWQAVEHPQPLTLTLPSNCETFISFFHPRQVLQRNIEYLYSSTQTYCRSRHIANIYCKELWCLDRRGSCEEDPGGVGDEASGLQGHGPLRRLLHPVRLLLRLLQHALQVTTNTREKIFLFQKIF